MRSQRTVRLTVAFVTVVVLLGFLAAVGTALSDDGATAEQRMTVTEDGEITSFELTFEFSTDEYEALEAELEGMTVAEGLTADIQNQQGEALGGPSDDTSEVAGGYVVEIGYNDVDVDAFEPVGTEAAGGHVEVTMDDVLDVASGYFETSTFVLEMPGDVLDEATNADDIDGTTATWNLHDGSGESMHAGSSANGENGDDENGDDENGDDENGDDENGDDENGDDENGAGGGSPAPGSGPGDGNGDDGNGDENGDDANGDENGDDANGDENGDDANGDENGDENGDDGTGDGDDDADDEGLPGFGVVAALLALTAGLAVSRLV